MEIPLSVPEIRGNEWKYVKECLDTGWVSSVGAFVDRFEEAISTRLGSPHCVATVNGTAALHVALLLAGVRPDDEVLVSTLSFIAPANAVHYVSARPVFVDAEPSFWQMDPGLVADFLERECRHEGSSVRNLSTGRRVAALLIVDILGHPVDAEPLIDLARTSGLPVVEDATESFGALYRGRPVGTLGDIACLSFNGNKLITTGGGGMIVTADSGLAERARYLTTQAKDDPIEFIHHEAGFNYRLTNLQAAMGCAQLERMDEYVAAKRAIAARYREGLAGVAGVSAMREAPDVQSVFWLYTIRVDEAEYGMDSRHLMRELAARGIQTRPLWQPLHASPAHAGSRVLGGEVAARLQQECLSLPCSVGLAEADQRRVIEAIAALRSRWAKPKR